MFRYTCSVIMLWLYSLCFYCTALAQTVTRGPYLQIGTPTSIVIRWRTDVATDSQVSYGTSYNNLISQAYDAVMTKEHEVHLSGLSPNTMYYYAIGSTNETLAGGDSESFFITSPNHGTEKPVRVWALGDSGTADSNARAVRNAYFGFNGNTYTDICLMLGDNAYDDGTDSEYQKAVFEMYPSLLKQTVLWPTLGNHDGYSADSGTQSGVYYDIFTLPRQGEAGGLASGTEAYYSFNYANIHFICLDSYDSSLSPNGAMLTWMENDLMATNQKWIIAYWHHPPYTKGSHDSDDEDELIDIRENALPILESYGVDLVLGGHSHSYERSYQLHGHYGSSKTLTSAMIVDNGDGRIDGDGPYIKQSTGALYVVAGSSGKTSGGSLNHPVMYFSLNQLGSLVIDIDGDNLHATFLDDDGVVRDYFTIIKDSQGNQAPKVNAGDDQTIILSSVAVLNGSVSDDGLPDPPGVLSTTWSVVSGPGPVIFTNSSNVNTTAGFSVQGTYVLRLTADDGAVAVSDVTAITVIAEETPPDSTPPTGSISINNGQSTTTSQSVTLQLQASDAGSGMGSGAQMRFSNDNTVWSTPVAYASTYPWTLSGGFGTKTVYGRFKDAAGNWMTASVADTIIYENSPDPQEGDGFADDFSKDSTAEYTLTDTQTDGGTGSLVYDGSGQRLHMLLGNDIGLQFSHALPPAERGIFSFDFLPTTAYPNGGQLMVRLLQDQNNYLELHNTDGYGAEGITKVVNGEVVDQVSFTAEYNQNIAYHIKITFSPEQTEVEAFGEILVMDTDMSGIMVDSFAIENKQQDAYYDNIFYTESTGEDEVPKDSDGDGMPDNWETVNGLDPNDAGDASLDNDNDGRTNLAEYLAGTDPNDPADNRPVANAGPNIITDPTLVILDGSQSSDPNGDPLSFAWTQNSGPAVDIIDSDKVTARFIGVKAGFYTFQLIVTNGTIDSLADTVRVTINNVAPNADPGANQIVMVSAEVILDGQASSDANLDVLSYQWSQTAGSPVTIQNAGEALASFTPVQTGVYSFALTVSDGVLEDSQTVHITVNDPAGNTVPLAYAGEDQTVILGTKVSLDGSGSIDQDGDPLQYNWKVISGPADDPLENPASASPVFTPSVVGVYTIGLTVYDGTDNSLEDYVMITVNNPAADGDGSGGGSSGGGGGGSGGNSGGNNTVPIADAGENQEVLAGDLVTLDGSGSYDADGDALTYKWVQTSGTTVTLSDANAVRTEFYALYTGSCTFALAVHDGKAISPLDPVTIVVHPKNTRPVAAAGFDQIARTDTKIVLDGSASYDIDGDVLSYSWQQLSGPPVSLESANTATTSFVTSKEGRYEFALTVSDGILASEPDTVMITVGAGQPDAVEEIHLVYPANEAILEELPILKWDAAGCDSFKVQLSKNNNRFYTIGSTTETFFAIPEPVTFLIDPNQATPVYWRVLGKNAASAAWVESEVWEFYLTESTNNDNDEVSRREAIKEKFEALIRFLWEILHPQSGA